MTGVSKLLIVKDTATVAEGRQATAPTSHRNNNRNRHKAAATVNRCTKTRTQLSETVGLRNQLRGSLVYPLEGDPNPRAGRGIICPKNATEYGI